MHVSDNKTLTYAYRVLFKKPGYPAERGEYTADSLKELLRWLKITEDVEFDTCEYLYVHLQLPNGGVQEVVSHDNQTHTSDKVIQLNRKARVYKPEDVTVLEEVSDLLGRVASSTPEPPPRKFRAGKVRTGFGVIAYPARSGDYGDK